MLNSLYDANLCQINAGLISIHRVLCGHQRCGEGRKYEDAGQPLKICVSPLECVRQRTPLNYSALEERVDEWSDSRALCEDDQRAERE